MKTRIICLLFGVLLVSPSIYAQNSTNKGTPIIENHPSELSTTNEEAKRLYDIGSSLIRDGKVEEAEKYLTDAIAIDPNFYEAMDHLGLVYKRMNRLSEAENMYLESIKITKENIVSYMNLANIYSMQGNVPGFTEALLRALAIDPNNPDPYFQLGNIFTLRKQFDLAIGFAKMAIERYNEDDDPVDLAVSYRMLGLNYFGIRDYENAITYLEKANLFFKDPGIQEIIEELIANTRESQPAL
ncbi:hypothetical protein AGMMS49928_28220 [Spirochaetia bacterium]|nr:hypothetical protein AGMMS49928_28220 [Spirochaetia bacterium]